MNKKRGIINLAFALVLLTLMAVSLYGQEQPTPVPQPSDSNERDLAVCDPATEECPIPRYKSLEIYCDDGPGTCPVRTFCEGFVGQDCNSEDNDCNKDEFPTSLPGQGCWIMASENDNEGNDCAYGNAHINTIISTEPRWIEYYSKVSADNEPDAIKILGDPIAKRSRDDLVICTERREWYECNREAARKNLLVLTGEDKPENIFLCTFADGYPAWFSMEQLQEKRDLDEDDVPTPWDCDDTDNNVYGEFLGKPAHPEICNDDKNNDCLGGSATEQLTEVGPLGDSSDDCNQNKVACESRCKADGESCAWISTGTENRCCGAGGITDIGAKASVPAQSGTGDPAGDYLCFYNKPEHQVVAGRIDLIPACQDKPWCWARADQVGNTIPILTIKKPGEESYDIVSNNDQWYRCEAGRDVMPISSTQPELANQFYCYNEGNKWSWAQCCWEGQDGCTFYQDINGIKVRQSGDVLYTLTSDLGNSLTLDFSSSAYGQRYGPGYWDFFGYNYLEFYLEYTADPVIKPDQIILTVEGPQGKLFQEDVLSYVINGPRFETGKKMHVQIPINNWRQVSRLSFSPLRENNRVRITHIQATKQGDNIICSGEKLRGRNTWLQDLDAFSPDFSGEKMCRNLGLTWLGANADSPYRCCGDDKGEYVGLQGEAQGCWNSERIAAGKTTANIQIELTYGQGEWQYTYDPLKVTGTVIVVKNQGTGPSFDRDTYLISEDIPIDVPITTTPFKVKEFTVERDMFIELNITGQAGGRIYVINPLQPALQYNQELRLTAGELPYQKTVLYIMAEADTGRGDYTYNPAHFEILTYNCPSGGTCSFPLKGSPPYTIENPHPEQYDLYFVNRVDNKEMRILIDREKIIHANQGWLEVQKVKPQILYSNGVFMGCGDLSSYTGIPTLIQSLNFCAVNTTSFCNVDGAWSSEEIPELLYDDHGNLGASGNSILPSQRNHSSSIVFGRNIIFNPWLGMDKR